MVNREKYHPKNNGEKLRNAIKMKDIRELLAIKQEKHPDLTKHENLGVALCVFGEWVGWYNDYIEEIPVIGSMECPITDRFKYDDKGFVIAYPNSDDVIGFDVQYCCKWLDEQEAKYLEADECNYWYDYVHGAYSALWEDIDFDDI